MKLRRRMRRRDFLQWSAASLSAVGLMGTPAILRRAIAGTGGTGKRLLFIFLRGGMDAVQTVIPYGDAGIPGQGIQTYLQARPSLGVDPSLAHDLNGFASLHPQLEGPEGPTSPRLASIFHGTLDERGPCLALLQRIGYESQNRSHFSSQQFWENGRPGEVNLEKGVLNNYISAYPDDVPLRAAALSNSQMVMLKGDVVVPALSAVEDFSLPRVSIGTPVTADNPLGTGLRGLYTQPDFDFGIPGEELAVSTGVSLLETLQFFEDNVHDVPYEPEPEAASLYAAIEDRKFAQSVMDAARLIKQVDSLQIAGCNQKGYDTHGGQNSEFPTLARDLGLALTALFHDLKPIWDNLIVLTMSEFGRTSAENGNLGTDHGEAALMTAMGGPVVGGVYNCDPATWAHGDLFSTPNQRYVSHRTDFRAVYEEVITRHLGDPNGRIDTIIPGFTDLAQQNTNGYFTPLGFIA